jgi:O-6-methylguanine DNA methyltransferase
MLSARPPLAAPPVALSCSHLALIPTAWGLCGVAWRDLSSSCLADPCIDAALTRIITPGLSQVDLRRSLQRFSPNADEVLCDKHGRFHPETVPLWFSHLVAYLQGYFGNALRHREEAAFADVWSTWKPRLDFGTLTPFQQKVLEIVARIPRGEVRTYGQIARDAGRPGAARAAGAALRSNPFPVLIPCHRVVGVGGKLTGFTAPGGVAAKKRMLELENAGLF